MLTARDTPRACGLGIHTPRACGIPEIHIYVCGAPNSISISFCFPSKCSNPKRGEKKRILGRFASGSCLEPRILEDFTRFKLWEATASRSSHCASSWERFEVSKVGFRCFFLFLLRSRPYEEGSMSCDAY